jgi:methionine-rich copper-binding protein CopC/tetratricopeptide (TPR) repeat protein
MGTTVILVEYGEEELKRAVEEAERMADGRSRRRAKLVMGILLAVAAVLVAAAFVLAAPLYVTATVDYMYTPEGTVAVIQIVINGSPNTTYGVEVRGPANETIAVTEVNANASGIAELELELPEIYPAGNYTVYVSGGGETFNTTFTVMWNITIPGAKVAAANLIQVAGKLGAMVHCRNEVLLAANVTKTELNATFEAVLSLTKAGDEYLSRANSSLNAGNYTAAMRYAQLAIQSYGKALELQEDIKEQIGVSFAACKAVIAPPKKEVPAPARNVTCKWTPEFYPLMTAFNVTERRIEELRALLAKLEERDYNVTGLAMMLDEAKKLVEEGRKLAQNCSISEAAHKLADAKKYIGAVDAAIAKLGGMRFVKEVRKVEIEINETEVKEALKKGKLSEKLYEKINETLRKMIIAENMSDRDLRNIEKRIENIEKLLGKLGKEKQISKTIGEINKKVEELRKNIEKEAARRAQEAKDKGDSKKGKP